MATTPDPAAEFLVATRTALENTFRSIGKLGNVEMKVGTVRFDTKWCGSI